MLQDADKDSIKLTIVIIDSIWIARNLKVFEGKDTPTHEIVDIALNSSKAFREAKLYKHNMPANSMHRCAKNTSSSAKTDKQLKVNQKRKNSKWVRLLQS